VCETLDPQATRTSATAAHGTAILRRDTRRHTSRIVVGT
jgi:hypothetical protein